MTLSIFCVQVLSLAVVFRTVLILHAINYYKTLGYAANPFIYFVQFTSVDIVSNLHFTASKLINGELSDFAAVFHICL